MEAAVTFFNLLAYRKPTSMVDCDTLLENNCQIRKYNASLAWVTVF